MATNSRSRSNDAGSESPQYGEEQLSGPDFVRFESKELRIILEFQTVKTP